MKTVLVMALFSLLLTAAHSGSAQPLRILGGNQLLQVTAGADPADPMTFRNTNSTLRWRREAVLIKIVVSTSCPNQRFGLRVLALSPSEGVAAPPVTLTDGMPPVDFVTNCPAGGPNNNTAILEYTAIASFAQGNSTELGNDVHVVTYTVIAQ